MKKDPKAIRSGRKPLKLSAKSGKNSQETKNNTMKKYTKSKWKKEAKFSRSMKNWPKRKSQLLLGPDSLKRDTVSMPNNILTIQPRKSPGLWAATGGTFQKKKRPSSKSNMKKKRLFMRPNRITPIELKSTRRECKSSMRSSTKKSKKSWRSSEWPNRLWKNKSCWKRNRNDKNEHFKQNKGEDSKTKGKRKKGKKKLKRKRNKDKN